MQKEGYDVNGKGALYQAQQCQKRQRDTEIYVMRTKYIYKIILWRIMAYIRKY